MIGPQETLVRAVRPVPELALYGVAAWYVDIDGLSARWRGEAIARLCARNELEQATRRQSLHSQRWLMARAVLRSVLGRALGVAPASVPLEVGEHGKPYVPDSTLGFSLSHSGSWLLLALAQGRELGVDVEVVRRVPEALSIACQHMPPRERDAVLAAPQCDRDRAFIRAWTRCEAIVKGAGRGLEALPDGIVHVDDGTSDIAACAGRWWRVHSRDAMGCAWAVAVEEHKIAPASQPRGTAASSKSRGRHDQANEQPSHGRGHGAQ